jgi:hypothetical protein
VKALRAPRETDPATNRQIGFEEIVSQYPGIEILAIRT